MKIILLTALLTLIPACDAMQYKCRLEVTPNGTVCVRVDFKRAS